MTDPAHPISQRDLRTRSREIMDALEAGDTFTITRDGREIGELVPLRSQRRFVARADFARGSAVAPELDLDRFRRDQERALDGAFGDDPYGH